MPGSIASLADAVRSGETTATSLASAALDAATESQPALNAFTRIDTEAVLSRAASVDNVVAAGGDPGPLAGVPIALKDLIDQAGVPNTLGAAFPPVVPGVSAPVVSRLEEAGAVVVGRTGLHEFAFGFSSENEHFGPVRNPWDATLSPGGSSGGSAAAVAAGVVPASIGTDTGGSVRVPAALCGVVGLKVTHGRVPLTGVYPLAPSLDTVGPLAASVADAAAVYEVIAGFDPADPWSVPRPVDAGGGVADVADLSVAVPRQWLEPPISPAVAASFRAALEAIARHGGTVEEVDVPALRVSAEAMRAHSVEIAATHRRRWTESSEKYGREVARRFENAFTVPADDLVSALEWRAGARNAAALLFERFDVLATPTTGATAKTIGVDHVEIEGEPVFYRLLLASYTAPINWLGFPALALPLPGSGTPPASLQLIGPMWSEADLLATGTALEDESIAAVERPPNWFGST